MLSNPIEFSDFEKELLSISCNESKDVSCYKDLVRKENWMECCFYEGVCSETEVEGSVWSDAIQKALDENRCVHIPQFSTPIYIDKPLIIHSGNCLKVESQTEIRLKPGTNTCMLRNENIIDGQAGLSDMDKHPDENIIIEGGIWNAMNNGKAGGNGNGRGNAGSEESIVGAHGTFLLNNVRNVRIKDTVIIECTSFAIHMCNCSRFIIENIYMPRIYRDGVHINGPADTGIIRGIRGKTGDDIVALNAWDWKEYTMTFGTISSILVEDVSVEPGYLWSELRLLAGTKLFLDGGRLDCDIKNCFFKKIKGIHTVKIYAQPNLDFGRDNDYSGTVGYLENISFKDVEADYINPENHYCKKDAIFEICSDINGIQIENVKVNFPLSDDRFGNLKLVAVGPLSATWKFDANDTSKWVEIFEPDAICKVKGLKLKDIYHKVKMGEEKYILCNCEQMLAVERKQKINPNYPYTIPKGGTGYGIIAD